MTRDLARGDLVGSRQHTHIRARQPDTVGPFPRRAPPAFPTIAGAARAVPGRSRCAETTPTPDSGGAMIRSRSMTRLFAVHAAILLVPVLVLGAFLAASYRAEANRRGLAEGRSEASVIA